VGAEAPDKYLVLWNYNYAYPQKTLAANVAAGATEIQVMDVTNMPAEGTVTLGAETLRYTSIRNEAGPPARHFLCGFVLAAPHIAGAAVKVREASNDFKHVWYGPGTVKHGTIN
jgi:hypothetical protein